MRSRFLQLTSLVFLLAGCSGDELAPYKNTTPVLVFEDFFNGPIKAQGLVQNRQGQVIRRFDIDMRGDWTGGRGTLDEKFSYYDGEKQTRLWNVRKNPDGSYTGTADDIIGEAHGQSMGSAIRWTYIMAVKTDGSTYNIHFDDWMYLMNDGTILNRSYMSKFGFSVGEITVVMRKL